MNEQPYDEKHLEEYTGILTSLEAQSGKFKMELKVEDNPVLERSVEKNVSSIELEFRYNGGPSAMFFHNRHTCPLCLENKECREYERIQKRYDIFYSNLHRLQFGDTFSIQAALINNDRSVLPAEIHSFENYQPLLAACTEYWLRLNDTDEGVAKKQEIIDRRLKAEQDAEEQRLQQEREAKEKREAEEIEARERKRKKRFQQFFGDSPYITQIIATAIGGVIAGVILTTIVEPIPRLFMYIYLLFFRNWQ